MPFPPPIQTHTRRSLCRVDKNHHRMLVAPLFAGCFVNKRRSNDSSVGPAASAKTLELNKSFSRGILDTRDGPGDSAAADFAKAVLGGHGSGAEAASSFFSVRIFRRLFHPTARTAVSISVSLGPSIAKQPASKARAQSGRSVHAARPVKATCSQERFICADSLRPLRRGRSTRQPTPSFLPIAFVYGYNKHLINR